MRKLAASIALAAAVALSGCHKPAIMPRDLMPPRVEQAGPLPSYAELVERYNANLAGLDRLWASTDVKLAWRDEKGKAKYEEGEGKFLFVPPQRVALTVEKLGKTYIWAGSDEERYWLFERQDDHAYVGRHENIGKPCAEALPLPVHPAAVPYLLGLVPLQLPSGANPSVEVIEGYYVVEPPGLALQMMLDPATFRPVRIDLLDATGKSVIVSRLRDYRFSEMPGFRGGPGVPGVTDLYAMGKEARVTLVIDRVSTEASKVQDRAFDFEALVKAMKPKEVVELDAGCP